jgi:hypothetical protein
MGTAAWCSTGGHLLGSDKRQVQKEGGNGSQLRTSVNRGGREQAGTKKGGRGGRRKENLEEERGALERANAAFETTVGAF